jgi:hypothetical protein
MLLSTESEAGRIVMRRLSDFETTALKHPDAIGLHAMWNDLRGERPAPFRAELDAGRIGARAPFLAILEYVGPSNFRIRIAGDRLNKWFGLELRGMSALSMIDAEHRNAAQAALNSVTSQPAVAAVHGDARASTGFSWPFEMVLLPMRSDFGKIDRVLVGVWLLDGRTAAPAPVRLAPTGIVLAPVDDAERGLDDALAAAAADGREPAPPPPAAKPVPASDAGDERDGTARRRTDEPMVRERGRRGHLRLVEKP